MKTAKQRGQHVGRPRKLSPAQIAHVKAEIKAGKPRKTLAAELGVSVATLRRMIRQEEAWPGVNLHLP